MKKSNNLASMQIFMTNNIDIQHSNTLDLHGLHVKEAIGVLKNVLNEKRNGEIDAFCLDFDYKHVILLLL